MKALLIVICWLFIWPHLSFAGTETHGGDVIVCYDRPLFKANKSVDENAKIKKLELKDYWEGKRESTYRFQPPKYKGNDYWKNAQDALFAIYKLDFYRHTRLEKRLISKGLNSFKRQIKFVEKGELPEVDDTSSVLNIAAGSNCYDRQLAVQKSGLGAGRASIFISMKIFDLLDPVNQAGIILHELLLEDELMYNKDPKRDNKGRILTDSIRLLNYIIVSDIYESKTRYFDYLNFVFDQNLLYFDEIHFNFQSHLFKSDRRSFVRNYPVITATHVKRYQHYRGTDFIRMDYSKDHRRGETEFTIVPGSLLLLSLNKLILTQVQMAGDFEIKSRIFEGASTHRIVTRGIARAQLDISEGKFFNSATFFNKGKVFCQSQDRGDRAQFAIETGANQTKVILSSDEFIQPCNFMKVIR